MDMQTALSIIGVDDNILSSEEKHKLDTDGYLVLHDILLPSEVAMIKQRLKDIATEEAHLPNSLRPQEPGTDRLSNLIDKDHFFEICYTHPRVLAAVSHILQKDFKLSSLTSRASLPGSGLQELHVDWGESIKPFDFQVCNSVWLLDDFTATNGATRVIPGSHQSGEVPSDSIDDLKAPHPDQILILAPAGSVTVFNSHLWHGGTLNQSDHPRYVLHSYFCRRHQPQATNQKRYLRQETVETLSDVHKFLLAI